MLDQISLWWNAFLSLFDAIPEQTLAITVYVGGTIIALLAWFAIARKLPHPLGAFTWVILFALLVTPTISEGSNASFAPAIIGMIFGILTKENDLIYSNLASILLVMGVGFILCYLWRRYTQEKST